MISQAHSNEQQLKDNHWKLYYWLKSMQSDLCKYLSIKNPSKRHSPPMSFIPFITGGSTADSISTCLNWPFIKPDKKKTN